MEQELFEMYGEQVMDDEEFFLETLYNDELSYKTEFPEGTASLPSSLETYWRERLGKKYLSALRIKKKLSQGIGETLVHCPARAGVEVMIGMCREGTTIFFSPRKVRFIMHTLSEIEVFFKCVLEYDSDEHKIKGYIRNVFCYGEATCDPADISQVQAVLRSFRKRPIAIVTEDQNRGEYWMMEYMSFKYGTFPIQFEAEWYHSIDQTLRQQSEYGTMLFSPTLKGMSFVRDCSLYAYHKVLIHVRVCVERTGLTAYVFDHEVGAYESVGLKKGKNVYNPRGVRIHLGAFDFRYRLIKLLKPAVERTYPASRKYFLELLQFQPQSSEAALEQLERFREQQ